MSSPKAAAAVPARRRAGSWLDANFHRLTLAGYIVTLTSCALLFNLAGYRDLFNHITGGAGFMTAFALHLAGLSAVLMTMAADALRHALRGRRARMFVSGGIMLAALAATPLYLGLCRMLLQAVAGR